MPCRRHCLLSGSPRVGLPEPKYRTQAMDERRHERFLGNSEAWLSQCRPETENFVEVADEFFSQGSGLKPPS